MDLVKLNLKKSVYCMIEGDEKKKHFITSENGVSVNSKDCLIFYRTFEPSKHMTQQFLFVVISDQKYKGALYALTVYTRSLCVCVLWRTL